MSRIIHGVKVDNLIILRDFLEDNWEAVGNHLVMREFCEHSWEPSESQKLLSERGSLNDCGTNMCLAGWSVAVPQFSEEVSKQASYMRLVHALYFDDGGLFSYVFGEEWYDDLDAGIERLDTLIDSLENGDSEFIRYVKDHGEEIAGWHGSRDDEWLYEQDEDEYESTAEGRLRFPMHETPNWFKRATV